MINLFLRVINHKKPVAPPISVWMMSCESAGGTLAPPISVWMMSCGVQELWVVGDQNSSILVQVHWPGAQCVLWGSGSRGLWVETRTLQHRSPAQEATTVTSAKSRGLQEHVRVTVLVTWCESAAQRPLLPPRVAEWSPSRVITGLWPPRTPPHSLTPEKWIAVFKWDFYR